MRSFCLLLSFLAAIPAFAQRPSMPPARAVYVDSAGVIRWKDSGKELALFGANYTLPSASDYRAAGYLGADRKKLIDEDMAQWARMGWDGLRISFWGDWENSDHAGNLIANDHLDLMDYLIARARERGIYTLLSPITTYQSTWPDATRDTTPPGFANFYRKSELGTNPAAIAAQVNYIQQLLRHVNPYTGVALKDDPSIIFVEMINEPTHHSADVAGSVAYINTLVDAVRSTGSKAITFHNLSQDFAMATPIAKSKVQGMTFGWYPTGLNSGHELRGNYLRTVDSYDPMRDPRVAKLPRIVYEFDSPDLRTGYMYPAMARTMRSVGAQFAAMFAYDMLATSSRNLGWQTHYVNLAYTPRKAMSAIVAAEAMRRLPRGKSYGSYPANTSFGDFHVSYEENSGVLAATDAYLNAGATTIAAPDAARLTRIAGYQSSPLVRYDGEGIYFLDRVRRGVWRLEVYPDAVPVRDPFEPQRADKIVTRSIARAWPMRISLPDLGETFTVQQLAGVPGVTRGTLPNVRQANGGSVIVTPGVYVLSSGGPVDAKTLPASLGAIGMSEYHAPPSDTMPVAVVHRPPGELVLGGSATLSARVVDSVTPDSVVLSVRQHDQRFFRRWSMRSSGPYEYSVAIAADSIGAGPVDYAITVVSRGVATTFPEGSHDRPWDWNYDGRDFWHASVVAPGTPLTLFNAGDDAPRLAFSRIGDGWREGIYRVVSSSADGAPVLHFELPRINGRGPDDYTASLVVDERIAARGETVRQATALKVRLRGATAGDIVHVTLVERDGTSWSAPVRADTAWTEQVVPLREFHPARYVSLPEGFPGEWNYWVGAPSGRGGSGDSLRLSAIERVQLSLRSGETTVPRVDVEWMSLVFR
ncbi:MAG: hypothetical protein ACJ79K_10305 [Gemmatimonadaceae bacterium]